MGYPVMFYIDEKNKKLLEQESNRSSLINELLTNHYSKLNFNPKEELRESKEKIEQDAERAKKKLAELTKMVESLEKKENEEKSIKEQEDQEKQKLDKIRKFVNDMTQEQNKEYLEGKKKGKWEGVTEYAKIICQLD